MRDLSADFLLAAHRQGLLKVSISKVARECGCSASPVAAWWKGENVSSALDAKIRRVLGGGVEEERTEAE
jgi:transposase-like protein